MKAILAFCLLCTSALAGPPAEITMHGGETLYVTGHDYTDRATRDGLWGDATIWEDGTVPTEQDRVWIPSGASIQIGGDVACATLVCQGDLTVLDGCEWSVSTVTGLPGAKLRAGAPGSPISWTVNFFSRPFEAGDEKKIGNGLIWCGHDSVKIYGAINGDQAWSLEDDGYHVSHSHSIVFQHARGDIKPHVMVMHGSGVVEGVALIDIGRTDKSLVLHAENNPAGRYAWHWHRGGEEQVSRMRWILSSDSIGWGIVNHSSHVIVEDSVVLRPYGACFIGEAANELGRFERCLALDPISTEFPHPYERQVANDRWHAGEGFAVGPQIELIDCHAAGCGRAFAWINFGLRETINGVTQTARFADGRRPERVPMLSPVRIVGTQFRRTGLSLLWNGFNEDGSLTRLPGVTLIDGGVGSVGIEMEYSVGAIFEDATIRGCDTAFWTGAMLFDSEVWFLDPQITGCRYGFRNNAQASLNSLTIRGGSITADMAVQVLPVRHQFCDRTTTVEGVDLSGSIDGVVSVDPGPPYDAYLPLTNDVIVKHRWPWESGE